MLRLEEAQIKTIEDLLWIFPLRVQAAPKEKPFSEMRLGEFVKGSGKIVSLKKQLQWGRKGKGRVQLFQVSCVVQDLNNLHYMSLKWFNAYPNVIKRLEELSLVTFMGQVQEFQNSLQVMNPKIQEYTGEIEIESDEKLIEYPTINGVAGKFVKSFIDKIPTTEWENIQDELPSVILEKRKLSSLKNSFLILHGKFPEDNEQLREQAKQRLIYQEFYLEQLKLKARRQFQKTKPATVLPCTPAYKKEILQLFSYELTTDQLKAFDDILKDFNSAHPMMRMLQGDVGCGKTTVAILSALVVMANKKQVALMAPTESLAAQHYKTIQKIFDGLDFNVALLLGNTKAAEKKVIQKALREGKIQLIIGTHSLIQATVEFQDLQLAIIDEQHKFGVEQRLKLMAKGNNAHCLIMTATPIPRTLSLTQYGDLDFSVIKIMPNSGKKISTRIVDPSLMNKYLTFIKTRLSLGEQVYIVVPSIEESEVVDLANINKVLDEYQGLFPEYQCAALHGKMSSQEKESALNAFREGSIHILVATSVVEVGIDIANATIMSIYDPERFGLSSLHQLRGRVGRASKPGFCFLVYRSTPSLQSLERLKVIENNTDGFKIAEADLAFRGEGDLFGNDQSGLIVSRRMANLIQHQEILDQVCADISFLEETSYQPLQDKLELYKQDFLISSTV
ncbi:MAG: ATP-dependent DNA helicase RecG [Bacteriovoracaceae bacterium]|nr:ATP-dependent DNA helicase RecG [Bacteriovoracaceae bacterium]